MLALALVLGLALPLWGCGQTNGSAQGASSSAGVEQAAQSSATETSGPADKASTAQLETPAPDYCNPGDGYTLKQVVVLSRHNIRAPLSTTGSALEIGRAHV